jgi:hypothetical protein
MLAAQLGMAGSARAQTTTLQSGTRPGMKESTMTTTHPDAAQGAAIRPFRVEFPQPDLNELRRRLAATRLPAKELVPDQSQGVQLATVQAVTRYWGSDYDFGRLAARLNALPQFKTEIDGVDIHYIHVKSRHERALPLIITHGWPGSIFEMLGVIGPLTDPTAHGGTAADAFDVVIPSIPGYGFSTQPAEVGWNVGRVAAAWGVLMSRLGYTRYVAQGGDQGAGVTDVMGRLAPTGLLGIHLNLLGAFPPRWPRCSSAARPSRRDSPRRSRRRTRRLARSSREGTSPRWASTRRRSATARRIRPPGWQPGCWTTTRTATPRCRVPSSAGSRPAA